MCIVFLYFCYDCIFILPPTSALTTAAIFLFSLISTEPITDMKIPYETENQLLLVTAPALKSNVHENAVVGHSPRKPEPTLCSKYRHFAFKSQDNYFS